MNTPTSKQVLFMLALALIPVAVALRDAKLNSITTTVGLQEAFIKAFGNEESPKLPENFHQPFVVDKRVVLGFGTHAAWEDEDTHLTNKALELAAACIAEISMMVPPNQPGFGIQDLEVELRFTKVGEDSDKEERSITICMNHGYEVVYKQAAEFILGVHGFDFTKFDHDMPIVDWKNYLYLPKSLRFPVINGLIDVILRDQPEHPAALEKFRRTELERLLAWTGTQPRTESSQLSF